MFEFFFIPIFLICIAALAGLPIGFFSKKYHVNLLAAGMSTAALFVIALTHARDLYPPTPSGYLLVVPAVASPYVLLFYLGTVRHKGAPGLQSRSIRRFQYAVGGACAAAFACWIFVHAGYFLFERVGYFGEIPYALMRQSNMTFLAFTLEGMKAMLSFGMGGGLFFFWLLCDGFWYVFALLSAGFGLWLASRGGPRE